MRYALYNFILDYITHDARKAQKQIGIKFEKGPKGLKTLVKNLWVLSPNFPQFMDFSIAAEEWYWLNGDRTSYYPETEELFLSWLDSQIDIKDPSSFYENEVFTLNIPKPSLTSVGELGSGILVSVHRIEDKEQDILRKFGNDAGFEITDIQRSKTMSEGEFSISASYNIASDGKGVTSRIVLTDDVFSGVIRDPSFENYKELLNKHNEMHYDNFIHIDDDKELHTQFLIVKLVAGFLLYKKAMGHRIVDGLPNNLLRDLETPRIDKRHHRTVKEPESSYGIEKGYHLRRSHYRQLMDSRYSKGDHEHKVKGSRILLISASVVGRKQKDKTAN